MYNLEIIQNNIYWKNYINRYWKLYNSNKIRIAESLQIFNNDYIKNIINNISKKNSIQLKKKIILSYLFDKLIKNNIINSNSGFNNFENNCNMSDNLHIQETCHNYQKDEQKSSNNITENNYGVNYIKNYNNIDVNLNIQQTCNNYQKDEQIFENMDSDSDVNYINNHIKTPICINYRNLEDNNNIQQTCHNYQKDNEITTYNNIGIDSYINDINNYDSNFDYNLNIQQTCNNYLKNEQISTFNYNLDSLYNYSYYENDEIQNTNFNNNPIENLNNQNLTNFKENYIEIILEGNSLEESIIDTDILNNIEEIDLEEFIINNSSIIDDNILDLFDLNKYFEFNNFCKILDNFKYSFNKTDNRNDTYLDNSKNLIFLEKKILVKFDFIPMNISDSKLKLFNKIVGNNYLIERGSLVVQFLESNITIKEKAKEYNIPNLDLDCELCPRYIYLVNYFNYKNNYFTTLNLDYSKIFNNNYYYLGFFSKASFLTGYFNSDMSNINIAINYIPRYDIGIKSIFHGNINSSHSRCDAFKFGKIDRTLLINSCVDYNKIINCTGLNLN